MSKTHNAGIVTAYGAAVRGGYVGTYEEFCAQQAQYAENARQMEQAVSDVRQIKTSVESAVSEAEGYANNANQSATNASNSATQASESASNANQSAESASQFANNASNSANSASQSATSAQTSATNASASEQNARQSAEDAQDILESVQVEGNTQIGRVQAKGDEIIASLPDDFTQVQNDIATLNGSLGQDVDFDDLQIVNFLISAESGKWIKNTYYEGYYFKRDGYGSKFTIKGNAEFGSVFALLAESNTLISNAAPVYATGGSRVFVPAGTEVAIDIPDDCTYIWVLKTAVNKTYIPTVMKFFWNSTELHNNIVNLKYTDKTFGIWELGSYNYPDGKNYTASTRIRLKDFVGIGRGFYSVKADEGYEFAVFAWNDETGAYVGALMTTGYIAKSGTMMWVSKYSFNDGYKYKIVLRDARDTSRAVNISESDNCIFNVSSFATDPTLTKKNWSADAEAVGRRFDQIEFAITQKSGGITHETPNSTGELNVVKRARQLTDIKWTPAVDIPRISQLAKPGGGANDSYFEDVFKAGVEYTGIPYGQATKGATAWGIDANQGFKVGWGVGLDTFISAVSNPESVVSKESRYVWSGATHLGSYYSTICTALCGYALALPIYYTSSDIGNAPGMTNLGKVKNINLEDLHLGDMLWNVAHGAIITDKLRDSNGSVIAIEISEATTIGNDDWNAQGSQYGGICRRRMWAVADFTKWGEYNVYRYSNVDNTPYTPSPYVNVGDEGEYMRVVNFPVVPYMGENFRYVSGKIVNTKILTPGYRAGYTDKLRVTKDGANWNADGTTDYYDVSGQYVEVNFSEPGTYTAYLCQVNNGTEVIQTRAAHWTVE